MIIPTCIAKLTVTKMSPATKALFLKLWREGVARCEAHAAEGCLPLTSDRGAKQHEELADYVARLADAVTKEGFAPSTAIATIRRPSLSPYVHTPTVDDLTVIMAEGK